MRSVYVVADQLIKGLHNWTNHACNIEINGSDQSYQISIALGVHSIQQGQYTAIYQGQFTQLWNFYYRHLSAILWLIHD